VKKMLERQLLAIKNAMLISQQAQASQQFAESMNIMAAQIGAIFGEMDLTQTQAQWEKGGHAGGEHGRADGYLPRFDGRTPPAPARASPAPRKSWSPTTRSIA